MDQPTVQLVAPGADLEAEYREFLREFEPVGQADQLHWTSGSDTDITPFGAYLDRVRQAQHGRGEGVPDTTYWLVRGRRILGTCNLRHTLTPAMWDHAGHVGYCVRPSERRRGYGTRMLALVLEKAAALGITEALLITSYDNLGSQRVIEGNGGRLISESYSPEAQIVLRRYRVPTRLRSA